MGLVFIIIFLYKLSPPHTEKHMITEPVLNDLTHSVFNELTEAVFVELISHGCVFVKTIGKKNSRKENLEQKITNSLDEITEYLKCDPLNTIKVKLAGNLHVLDIDAHEGSTLNQEQIYILENYFADSGFFTD